MKNIQSVKNNIFFQKNVKNKMKTYKKKIKIRKKNW
jgi:hypothetical protein